MTLVGNSNGKSPRAHTHSTTTGTTLTRRADVGWRCCESTESYDTIAPCHHRELLAARLVLGMCMGCMVCVCVYGVCIGVWDVHGCMGCMGCRGMG